MRFEFEWNEDDEIDVQIGYHEVVLTIFNDNEVYDTEHMSFWDYTTPYHIETDIANKYRRPYAFETHWCNGWSKSVRFDYNDDYDKCFGYRGTPKHTVEDIKRYCEEFLARRYMINYEEAYNKLQTKKKISDMFSDNGYGTMDVKVYEENA